MTSTGILYLQKDKFDIYLLATGKSYEFRFIPEIIMDLDVINPELLENLIKLFVANNKITLENMTIVLSDNACFIQDFTSAVAPKIVNPNSEASKEKATEPILPSTPGQEELQEKIKNFIEHVPFDKVVSKTVSVANGKKAVATNQDFYETIQKSFEKLGFKVISVIPGIVLGNNISSKNTLDFTAANTALMQNNLVKDYNFLDQIVPEEVKKDDREGEKSYEEIKEVPEKKNNKRIFVMLGVFGVLILILVIVVIINPNK